MFGFRTDDHSSEAQRHRALKLCPFNNRVPNCTKDKASDPLGVCSIYDNKEIVITCPVRFRERWLIAEHAASFFFPQGTQWTSLREVSLKDRDGKEAGNIDMVLVAYDQRGRVTDYGALEVQAVYISGNVRRPFEYYMEDPASRSDMDWRKRPNYPRPDYLSSSRKRLAPQLLYRGGILHAWGRKMAVALNDGFYSTLPALTPANSLQAEMAWLIYGQQPNAVSSRFELTLVNTVYTQFGTSLDQITKAEPGDENGFVAVLQDRLDRKLDDDNPPDTATIELELP